MPVDNDDFTDIKWGLTPEEEEAVKAIAQIEAMSLQEQTNLVRLAILKAIPKGPSFTAITIALAECIKLFQEDLEK